MSAVTITTSAGDVITVEPSEDPDAPVTLLVREDGAPEGEATCVNLDRAATSVLQVALLVVGP